MKRAMDLVGALAALVLLSPIVVVLCILVRSKLGSPVFFRQVRPGIEGRPFKMVKFRTMTDERDTDGALLPDDQRLTALGAWLRSTSLDELPELWNVLNGDMSLVGPRPLHPCRMCHAPHGSAPWGASCVLEQSCRGAGGHRGAAAGPG